MKPFSNHQTKSNTAFVALLVWLFEVAINDDQDVSRECGLKACDDGVRVRFSRLTL